MPVAQAHDFFFQWHLTERCNLSCTHCYQDGRGAYEIPLSGIREVIGEISDMLRGWSETYGISLSPGLNITGGEPFLRSDFREILEALSGRGFEIHILSNGTLIDKERAGTLAGLDVKGVQVSIEGPGDVHEAVRGRGSFDAAVNGVRNLLDSGLDVALNITLSELNADCFAEMVSLSLSLGVHKLGFSRLVPSGRGAAMLGRMLGKEKVKSTYAGIFSMETNGLKIVTGDPVASQMFSSPDTGADVSTPAGGCAAGISGMTLLADGTVVPCRRLPIPLGNVQRDSLREIWAASPVLERLRDKSAYNGRCGKCTRWANCRGCRAIAYAVSRSAGGDDFLADDPQCFFEV